MTAPRVESSAQQQPVERFVESNGLRLHLLDWGGNGRPLVLLHGLASNAHIWDFVAPRLLDQARVVAVNQRSHGLSEGPDEGYGFEQTTADLAGVIMSLGLERPVIAGHSWGASVAVEFAARYPAVPAGLVLVDGAVFSPRNDFPSWEDTERRLAPPRLAGVQWSELLARIRSGDMGAFWRPEFEHIIHAQFRDLGGGAVEPYLSYERHMKIVRALWETRTRDHFGDVECPVLLLPAVRGEGEMVQRKREGVAAALELLRDGRVVWLEDSIHDVPLQRPELVASAIADFLGTLPA
jgi:pimeloyl-ACP methyl ester carboxylesterase